MYGTPEFHMQHATPLKVGGKAKAYRGPLNPPSAATLQTRRVEALAVKRGTCPVCSTGYAANGSCYC